jgi:hypothetical protein
MNQQLNLYEMKPIDLINMNKEIKFPFEDLNNKTKINLRRLYILNLLYLVLMGLSTTLIIKYYKNEKKRRIYRVN